MISFDEAKQIALEHIGPQLVLIESATLEKPYGWVLLSSEPSTPAISLIISAKVCSWALVAASSRVCLDVSGLSLENIRSQAVAGVWGRASSSFTAAM